MNPDYFSLFRVLSQHSQSVDGVYARLNKKRKSFAAATDGKLRRTLSENVLEAERGETYLQERIAELTQHLELCRAQTVRHRQLLADWHTSQPGLKSELKLCEEECFGLMAVKEREIAVLRVWGKQVAFEDLSDELLVVVLGCFYYADQQRMTRVSRRWQHVIATGIDHIYLDWPAVRRGCRLVDYRVFHGFHAKYILRGAFGNNAEPDIQPWQWPKRNFNAIRRMTFHAGFRSDFPLAFPDLVHLIQLCPNMAVLTLNRLSLDRLAEIHKESELAKVWILSPTIQVAIVDCMVWAFGKRPRRLTETELVPKVDYRTVKIRELLGDRTNTYVPVADIILTDPCRLLDCLADDRLTWPHPVEQMAWLQQHVPCLNQYPKTIRALKL